MTSRFATTGAKSRFEAPCPFAVISPVIRSGAPQGPGTDCLEALEFAELHGIHDILDINALVWLDLGENRSIRAPTSQSALCLIAEERVTCRIAAEDRRSASVKWPPDVLHQRLSRLAAAFFKADDE